MTIKLTDGLYTVETVVLAQNNGGLKALYQLSSAIKMKEKEIPLEWLKRYDKNLLLSSKILIILTNKLLKHLMIKYMFISIIRVMILLIEKVWLKSARYLNRRR